MNQLQSMDESLISQLAKYANAKGSSHFDDMVSTKQLKAITSNNLSSLPIELLEEVSLKPSSVKQSEIKQARVCPVCIAESQTHYQEFQSKEVMACPLHHCLLVDVCPHCFEPLEFDTNLFRGICTNYRCHKLLEVSYAPSNFLSLSKTQIEDCLHAGLFEKHYQSGQVSIRKSNLLCVSQLALRGYELLTLTADTDELLQSVRQHYAVTNAIPGFMEYIQKTMLGSLSIHWAWSDYVYSTNVNVNNSGTLIKPVLVGATVFCRALGISQETLHLLSEKGLIRVHNGNRLNSQSIINITPIINHLTALPQITNGDTFEVFLSKNPGFSLELDELLAAWLKGEVQLGIIGKKTISDSIVIDSDSIRKWMLNHAGKVTKQKLNTREVLNVLKTSKSKYLSLIKSGKLSAVKTDTGFMHRFDDVAAIKQQLSITPQLSIF